VPLAAPPFAGELYTIAQNGAFDRTLTLGTVGDKKVIMWNGLYDGQGGAWLNGKTAPKTSCDNMWEASPIGSGAAMQVTSMSFTSMPAMCQGFVEATYCPASSWAGDFYEDLFTPDEWCTGGKTRKISLSGGQLVVSYANCDGDGGYVAANSTKPNLVRTSMTSCSATVSFKGEFAQGSKYYDVSQNGGLSFKLTMGTFNGARVIKWSGVHQGQGGCGEDRHPAPTSLATLRLDAHACLRTAHEGWGQRRV